MPNLKLLGPFPRTLLGLLRFNGFKSFLFAIKTSPLSINDRDTIVAPKCMSMCTYVCGSHSRVHCHGYFYVFSSACFRALIHAHLRQIVPLPTVGGPPKILRQIRHVQKNGMIIQNLSYAKDTLGKHGCICLKASQFIILAQQCRSSLLLG